MERSEKMAAIIRKIRVEKYLFSALIVGILVLGFATNAFSKGYKTSAKEHRSFSAEGITEVKLENSRGDISIVGVKGSSYVEFDAIRRIKANNEEEVKKIIDLLKVETEVKGSQLIIRAKYPERNIIGDGLFNILFGGKSSYRVDFELKIPESISCKINTASGDVSVSHILGNVNIATSSGDIELREAHGINIETSSGDLLIENCIGNAAIRTASGDMKIAGLKGDIDIKTASGDMVLKGIDGNVTIKTASGDAIVWQAKDVYFKGASGFLKVKEMTGALNAYSSSGDVSAVILPSSSPEINVSTSSGDVAIYFKESVNGGFTLSVQTANGEISADLPAFKVEKISRNFLVGSVEDAAGRVKVQTATGDILLKLLIDEE